MKAAAQELPATAGIELANWNWKVVHRFVRELFGLSLCRSGCLNWLHCVVEADPAAQAASSCLGQDCDSWHSTISKAWQPAVEEVIEQYLKTARHSFKESDHIQGAETLTDAVRATMGYIAATRNWPHYSHDNLYAIAAALGSGRDWPNTLEEFDWALEDSTQERDQLSSALGASMGLPGSLRFGSYCDNPQDAEENGFSFAVSAIQLARQLANREAQ